MYLRQDMVVNCFQIVSLRYWAQLVMADTIRRNSCELLSNCIFEILSTASGSIHSYCSWLWIAFKLYLWDIEHSPVPGSVTSPIVVNCFQIVSLRYWAQLGIALVNYIGGCELLSNCIFEILSTAVLKSSWKWKELWIAFKLYLWDIEHSLQKQRSELQSVVNCFQIVSLRYWAQQT